eukprot:4274048-Amphidinium_carterae.1
MCIRDSPLPRILETDASVNQVFQVGQHSCIITENGTRMACRNCKRYVTTCKVTRANGVTSARCGSKSASPRPRRFWKGETGKAPPSAKKWFPALPAGSLTRGRTKGPRKKKRLEDRPDVPPDDLLDDLPAQVTVEREFGVTGADARNSVTSLPVGSTPARQSVTTFAEASVETASLEANSNAGPSSGSATTLPVPNGPSEVIVWDALLPNSRLSNSCVGIAYPSWYTTRYSFVSWGAVLPFVSVTPTAGPSKIKLSLCVQAATTRNVAVSRTVSAPHFRSTRGWGSAAGHRECSAVLAGQLFLELLL